MMSMQGYSPRIAASFTRSWVLAIMVCVYTRSLQKCPTLCNLMNHSPPSSSVHGILQARILEWVAIPFSRGSSRPRGQTQVSHIAGIFLYPLSHHSTQQDIRTRPARCRPSIKWLFVGSGVMGIFIFSHVFCHIFKTFFNKQSYCQI